MQVFIWSLIGFVAGSIPFSLLVGRLAGKGDIRAYGDHNPGAANVLHAAGWIWALIALLLDALKGTAPVGFAWFFLKLNGWEIVPVALAPVAGHAFSPFLRFQGGKAIAVTFGIWAGLTIGSGPTILGILLGLFFSTTSNSGWAVLLSMLCFGVFIWTAYAAYFPEFMWIWLGNLLLLAWMQKADLKQVPKLRAWKMRQKQGRL